jgi:hypothetical protein
MELNKMKRFFGLLAHLAILIACDNSVGDNTNQGDLKPDPKAKNEPHLAGHNPFVFKNNFLSVLVFPNAGGRAKLLSPTLEKTSGPPPGYLKTDTLEGYLKPIYADTEYISTKDFNFIMGSQGNDSESAQPVEVTMEDAMKFCNKLSEKYELEKVYFFDSLIVNPLSDLSRNGFRLLHPLELYCLKSEFKNMELSDIEFVGGATGKYTFGEEVFSGDRVTFTKGGPSSATSGVVNLYWSNASFGSKLNCEMFVYGYTKFDFNGNSIDNTILMSESKVCADEKGRFRIARNY